MPMSDKRKLLAYLLWIVTNRRCLETLVGTRNIHRHAQAKPKGLAKILGCTGLCSTSRQKAFNFLRRHGRYPKFIETNHSMLEKSSGNIKLPHGVVSKRRITTLLTESQSNAYVKVTH